VSATVNLFYSFRSPYSYLATPEALALEQDFTVRVALRPVFPLALRQPDFFNPDNVKRAKYIMMDWLRRAEMLGLPHHWPSPDPIVQDLKSYAIATEQPYIYRLTYLGVEAQRRDRGIRFAAEVPRLASRRSPQGRYHQGRTRSGKYGCRNRGPHLTPAGSRKESGRSGICRPLGRTDFRIQWRTIFWTGPHRHAALAVGEERIIELKPGARLYRQRFVSILSRARAGRYASASSTTTTMNIIRKRPDRLPAGKKQGLY